MIGQHINNIKKAEFSSILSSESIVVTNQDYSSWGDLYYFDANDNISSEMPVASIIENPTVFLSPLVCLIDSNEIKITYLNNGMMRIELVNGNLYWDAFKWTFSNNAQILTGNPIIVPCEGSGKVYLEIYKAGTGIIHTSYCNGSKTFFCNCGEKRSKPQTLVRTINGETWRIQALIWVKSGEVGCEMSYKRKRLGFWLPASNKRVCTDISGTYKKEQTNKSCIDISVYDYYCLGNGTYPTSISVKKKDIDKIFREPDKLSSGHRVNVKGTWFGFGINGVPRLVLD
ncbi:MAG: hypothetical protein LC107_12400 [Chitinophagales bacterium]|nr:hypothetical protein [Chitinophagales bacterium]